MNEDLKDKVWSLLFDTRRSRRYHEWRIKFFQRFGVARLTLVFLSTSATFIMLLKATTVESLLVWIAGAAALLTGLEYAVRFSARETLHRSLLRSFVELERDIVAKGNRIDETQFDQFLARYTEIELDEPPVLQNLNRLCYNAEVRARYPEKEWSDLLKEVHWIKRLVVSVYDLFPHYTNKSNRLTPHTDSQGS